MTNVDIYGCLGQRMHIANTKDLYILLFKYFYYNKFY